MKLSEFAKLKRGDVLEVRIGREIHIFTVDGFSPEEGPMPTLVNAVDTDGKRGGIYFRDVISHLK